MNVDLGERKHISAFIFSSIRIINHTGDQRATNHLNVPLLNMHTKNRKKKQYNMGVILHVSKNCTSWNSTCVNTNQKFHALTKLKLRFEHS